MIKLLVHGKQFGKPFITYKILDADNDNQIIKEGKCTGYEMISEINFSLIKEHGIENVKMLSR